MNSSRPRVTALVPVWRAASFLRETLEHLERQTYEHLEVLISDDASPDESAAIAESFATRDARFRVLRQPRNLGWVGNVNALLAAGTGELFLFAFQDDLLAPTYVERCASALLERPQAVMAFTDLRLVDADGSQSVKTYRELDGIASPLERARRVARQESSWWVPNRGVFRAEAVRTIGGLRRHAAGEFSADWPWLLHLSLLGEFVRVPETLCTKIYQPRSLSRSWAFGFGSWRAVTASAMEVVSRSRLPWAERLALRGELAACLGGHARDAVLRAARRMKRGAGPSSEPTPMGSRD